MSAIETRGFRSTSFAACTAAACALLLGIGDAHAQATWDMASLEQNVQPMEHQLNGFMPILPWGLPVPIGTDAVTAQQNGTLLQDAQALYARGIALVIDAGWPGDTGVGDVATAQTLQSAGLPVYVYSYLYGNDAGAPAGLDGNGTAFWPLNATPNPWASDGSEYWPAFPLATPTAGYDFEKNLLQNLANGGITSIQGLFTDYESFPVYWADMKASINQRTYFSQYYTDAYAAGNGVLPSAYGPDLLTNDTMDQNNPMWRYSYDLRYALLKRSARQALTDVFGPGPIYGNYDAYYSSTAIPFDNVFEGPHPPSQPAEAGIAAMPETYAYFLEWYFENMNPGNVQPTQQTADDVYWYVMLTEDSTSQANDGSVGKSIPFVTNYVQSTGAVPPWSTYSWMTPAVYKELLRHLWLRGASGMYVFESDPTYEDAQDAFDNLEYARSVLDEMLSFRTFLTNGAPMNFAVNSSMYSGGVEWSGMSNSQTNPTRWVVRTVSRTGSDSVVSSISPQPGLTFTNLPAPANGATFILNNDGTYHRVDSEPASVYLQFENNYNDSSGSGLNGTPTEWPSTVTPPTIVADVPNVSGTVSVLNGAYGLYANQNNTYSVSLSRDPSSIYTGSTVRIPDTGGVFNTSSFTVETFVKVASGITQDSASLVSKGVNAAAGGYDWIVAYRDFAGPGMIEVDLSENSSTYAWIRTAGTPLTPDVWHHLALTYDGATRQITIYVDGVAQPFGNHNSEISSTGVLNWSFEQHTNDQLAIGYFDRGIDAEFDEFRFTPEVLDPLQMLQVGALD